MRCFGWTVEYVLGLSWPVFTALTGLVSRTRLDEAVDTVYSGYSAGKFGGKSAEALFRGRGDWFETPEVDYDAIDQEALLKARERMARIQAKKEE